MRSSEAEAHDEHQCEAAGILNRDLAFRIVMA